MKPFVKWAGGKRQILNRIIEYVDDSSFENEAKYIEPFLGGGAVFFNLSPKNAVINDLNDDLINVYKVIASNRFNELIERLKKYQIEYQNTEDKEEYYYEIRSLDRKDNWPFEYSNVERAARMIFLNRTCYNGLYRVNSKGQFNTPIGRYRNPTICDEENLKEIHDFLYENRKNITIMSGSYENAMAKADSGDLIYIDPPYDYEDDDGFTKYQMQGFTFEDFRKLKNECDNAIDRGAYVVISNNATQKVIDLFEQDTNYKIFNDINKFETFRNINCKGSERKTGHEVIICGMNCALPQANNMDSIKKLLLEGQDAIDDKEKAKKILNVKTDRQVSYYISALFFLNLIDKKRKLTDKAKDIINSSNIDASICDAILEKDVFKKMYEKFCGKNDIKKEDIKEALDEKNYTLSPATLERRASTIKSWLEWIESKRLIK